MEVGMEVEVVPGMEVEVRVGGRLRPRALGAQALVVALAVAVVVAARGAAACARRVDGAALAQLDPRLLRHHVRVPEGIRTACRATRGGSAGQHGARKSAGGERSGGRKPG